MRRSRASSAAIFIPTTAMRRPNRRHAIRAKRRLARAPTSARAVKHENIFVAKNCDSESAKRLRGAILRVATRVIASITRNA
ncbi:bsl5086 [Bradyrhizobium diazoefficiens USDA 110]|jgi:hypothetical protein|uniref:Bsl5086 protein n=1 Tax=Bradyrhizobium diazoefficiens (strain JCM 10833 / BCRC 13528 / IAM 13628 / NBRC 14792 / USDA 110) TaxID=224911 RepID=Q89K32_BRADU|nr:hypothetical protein CO678_22155 [Bradyrhizobium diazoefficiens]QBP23869.1 hypothetical protein Bdiaspc4_26735 [Bradyrhizobium diazoefficiens]QHP69924.1 hypothetical protein EI171_23085 [Bradyrhizobium sp. LCT2]BAC50351.1 bsl5086 [Bradyrhizobium diazoefficiens USDA 110]